MIVLAALALMVETPAPATLDAVIDAFDAACVAPGPDVAAERAAIQAMETATEAKQSTAPPALEGYSRGAISFLLIPAAKGSLCGLTATLTAEVNVAALVEKIAKRYSVAPSPSRGTKTVQGAYWTVGTRVFNFELSDQNGVHALLMSVNSKGS